MSDTQCKQIELIMADNWYKTADAKEMRIALMHLQQHSIDRLFNSMETQKNDNRNEVFEELSNACRW